MSFTLTALFMLMHYTVGFSLSEFSIEGKPESVFISVSVPDLSDTLVF